MLQPESFFGNLFDDKNITTTRLSSFSSDFINNMTAANDNNQYTALINLVKTPLDAVKTELGDVASSLAFQKGTTKTNDQVLDLFIATMRSKKGVIADLFGSEEASQYLAFYPQGIKPYNKANKSTMPTLTDMVATAAKKYQKELGSTLATLLQSFPQQWADSRNTQEQQKGDVKDNRSDRTDNRVLLETALCQALHTIGAMFPAQPDKCMALFSFAMLYPQTKHKHETFSNVSLAPSTSDTVLNRTLTDTYEISIRNTDDNATIAVWLAADEKELYPGNGVEVQPGKTMIVKPSKLGDLKNTFLRVINLSDVNDGSYDIEIS